MSAITPAGVYAGWDYYRCPYCDRDSLDAAWLAEHIRLVHEIPQPVAEQREPATAPARRARRVTAEPAASETPETPAVTTEE
jgi:hypothetical protein